MVQTLQLLSPPKYGAATHLCVHETQQSLCGRDTEFWYICGSCDVSKVTCRRCLKVWKQQQDSNRTSQR